MFTSCHVASRRVTSRCISMSSCVALVRFFASRACLCHVTLCCVVSCHVRSCDVTSWHVVSCQVRSCHVMSRRVVSCRVFLCCVGSLFCFSVASLLFSCRVTSCHDTSWQVMACHVMSLCRVAYPSLFVSRWFVFRISSLFVSC